MMLSHKENTRKPFNGQMDTRNPDAHRNKNGRPIRPLMHTIPYSLVKQESSTSSNTSLASNIHSYYKNQKKSQKAANETSKGSNTI